MPFKVAVVGATGNVGREMLTVLAERAFPARQVVALASQRSNGTEISFGDAILKVKALEHYDFKGTDLVLMSAGSVISKTWAPKIAAQGALVIDNSSAWRMDRDVPLIVPEVNADALEGGFKKGIIANPNCSTVQLVVALKPLHDEAQIKRVVVSTYQSVSGAGKDAMDELFRQTRAVFVADPIEVGAFAKQIAYNVIPQIDDFLDSGVTKEEWKMMVETQKILDPDIQVTATCVRVPVFIGHSESVTVEFERPITAERARGILRAAPGVLVVDKREDGGYVTPVEAAGEDATFVSRIRKDPTVEHGLSMWIVADNLRKGAALNAVQIAESLINRNLLKSAGVSPADFAALVKRFGDAATAGDGKALAACFTPDGTYFDYIYGPHTGRDSIADMLENLFHRDAAEYDWTFYDPVVNGDIGYAWSLSTFVSRVPAFEGKDVVIDGISRFVLKDGLIAEYHESVNGGVAQSQLGVPPERMAKVMARWSGNFRARADVESYRAAVRARYAGRR